MPAKVTSKIAWKSEEQKKRATKWCEKKDVSLSSVVQDHLDNLTLPKKK